MKKKEMTSSSSKSSKRLLFDRRYGWVIDEWKSPSQEALSGGRGMFCVVPLAKGFLDITFNSMNMLMNSVDQILERHDNLSPQQFQATIGNQLHQLAAFAPKPVVSLLTFRGKPFFSTTANSSLHQNGESKDFQEPETV